LAVLRAKTDRQLIDIIASTLDRGYALLQYPAGEESLTLAEDVYCEAFRLSSALYDVPAIERRRVIARLKRFRQLLDKSVGVRIAAAC
jgi:hypothetical protein